jgi:lactate permease
MSTLLLPALVASLPIVVVLVTMPGLGWGAGRAGGTALAVTLALCLLPGGWVPAQVAAPGPDARVQLVVGSAAEAGWAALSILWILWPALALHHHQERSGALGVLQQALPSLSPHRPVQLLLVAWFLALFFEGAAGFGAPVALCAPLLVAMGCGPCRRWWQRWWGIPTRCARCRWGLRCGRPGGVRCCRWCTRAR